MGVTILIPALIVVVVGGLGSLKGSLIGSLMIGQAETFGKAWLPERVHADHLRGDGRHHAGATAGALRPPAQVTGPRLLASALRGGRAGASSPSAPATTR